MRRSQCRIVLVVSAAALLTGCASAPVETATPEAPSASPTPTYVQPAVPASTLPLDCPDMLSLGFVQDHYRGDTLTASVDQTSTPSGTSYRVFAQDGGLRCVWGGSGRTDGGYDIGLSVDVVGDGVDGYAAWIASPDRSRTPWVTDAYGDASSTFCSVTVASLRCYGDVLAAGYWLSFSMSDTGYPLSDAEATTWEGEQLEPLVAALRSAGEPRPAWVPPADSFDGADLCTPDAAAAVAGGTPTVTALRDDGVDQMSFVSRRADARIGCRWTTAGTYDEIDVSTQRGGAWALDGILANPQEAVGGLHGAAKPVDVAGADAAFIADGESAWGALVVRGSLVEVWTGYTYTGADLIPLLEKIAARIGTGA